MLTRETKEGLVKDLTDKITGAKAVFLTNLIGVESNQANEIRKNVRDAKGTIVITRNTLFERAAKGTPAEEMLAGLKGPNAVAIAFEDAPGVAKALYDAGQDIELVTLEKGILNGKLLEKSELTALAKLPSRDTMLATVLATMNAPVSAFVRVLGQIRDQKESGAEAPAAAEAATTEEKIEE